MANFDFTSYPLWQKFVLLIILFIGAVFLQQGVFNLYLESNESIRYEKSEFEKYSSEIVEKNINLPEQEINVLLIDEAYKKSKELPSSLVNFVLANQISFNFICFTVVAIFFRWMIYQKKTRYNDVQFKNPNLFFFIPFLFLSALPILSESVKLNEYLGLNQLMNWLEFDYKTAGLQGLFMSYAVIFGDSLSHQIIIIIGMAIIPAIGEELIFRGGIQRLLHEKNTEPHKAIFITALIFSLFHFEFVGFFYRFLLGVILGYVYYWSSNILIPIFLHLLNNAITLIYALMYTSEKTDTLKSESSLDTFTTTQLLFSVCSLSIILYLFWKNKQDEEVNPIA
jgi:hypothetical protein